MTNSEAIEELRSRKLTMSMCIDIESCRNANNAIDMSIQALEENDKLKAEIDRLKIEPDKEALDDAFDLGYQTCLRHNGVCWKDAEEIQKLRKEIEQLKSELEQLSKQYSNVESLYHKYYNLHKKGQVAE